MPDVTGYNLPNHDETFMYADKVVRSAGYGAKLPIVTGSTDAEFLANIEALCAEKVKFSTFQAVVYPPGNAFDGNSFIAQIWHNTDSSGKKFIKIKAHGVTTTGVFQRVCYQITWSEPEWVNPPMKVGVEYRTTERYNGKAVYMALINLGYGPNSATFDINTGLIATEVFRVTGRVGGGGSVQSLPYANNTQQIDISGFANSSNQLFASLKTNFDATSKVIWAQFWYIKE